MGFTRKWGCAFCGKQVKLRITGAEAREKDAYTMRLPEGWAWHKYTSMRCPAIDTRTLGCSPAHAKKAAELFTIPEDMS